MHALKPIENKLQNSVHNRILLKQLERERKRLETYCYGYGYGFAVSMLFSSLWILPAVACFTYGIRRLQKASQLYFAISDLIQAFGDDIEIQSEIEVPEHGNLDLLVRHIPGKVNIAIALRSQGQAKVYYREDKQQLFRRRYPKGGTRAWDIDHLTRLGEQEFWLRKNNREVFGRTSRQRNRPLLKILALTGKTILRDNPEDKFYEDIQEPKSLFVKKRTSIYVMEGENIVNFIKAWLDKR